MEIKRNSLYPWVISPELANVPLEGWRTERPVMDHAICCQCGTCYLYCPTGCIEEGEECFTIRLDFCKGCGTCEQECPNQAITMVREE
ncbi:4Fe-4S binding protein [Thermodesulfobacteriota bacterium]